MDWITRLDVIVLAIMLAYVAVVVIHVSYRYRMARREGGVDAANQALRRTRTQVVAELSVKVGNLKSIAFAAPYLGLAGTCFGILEIFSGWVGPVWGHLEMTVSILEAALATTLVGILVALPATWSYNYLRTRVDLLESEIPRNAIARRFPLTKRFSEFPAFALIAAPCLAILVAGYLMFANFHPAKGFGIELAPSCCECANDRVTLLHITDAGNLLLNEEQEDWNGLAGRLSEIYSVREQRTLDLIADDGLPFQTVADALDIVQNTPVDTIRLITPGAMNACVLEPVAVGSSQHASR